MTAVQMGEQGGGRGAEARAGWLAGWLAAAVFPYAQRSAGRLGGREVVDRQRHGDGVLVRGFPKESPH